MYQAHAHQLLNQKDDAGDTLVEDREHPMFLATRRLVAALDRLEDGLEQVAAKKRQTRQPVAFERENEALLEEREKLNTAISDLQGQYDGLHKVASTIYNKLDDSIKRLTHIIEN